MLTDVLHLHWGGKIQGHFKSDYRQDLGVTHGSEQKINLHILAHTTDNTDNTDDNDSETLLFAEF